MGGEAEPFHQSLSACAWALLGGLRPWIPSCVGCFLRLPHTKLFFFIYNIHNSVFSSRSFWSTTFLRTPDLENCFKIHNITITNLSFLYWWAYHILKIDLQRLAKIPVQAKNLVKLRSNFSYKTAITIFKRLLRNFQLLNLSPY